MRLDKYLKVARILKRRSISKEMADNSRVFVNEKAAKPSHTVKVGDQIEIFFGNRKLKIKVLAVADSVKKEEAENLYEVCDEE